ncbi:PIR Superfamily Protein [Plasmodium ovale curtisi]|uniref:PIR Superfamily Protein n=1 Tax=Plasmodium ovale curtisi TaxID=864141 RepID=A0A1A8VP02_PLAOA|nr:PIR Superfamily Protein [Plasmodium ovale curtisi]
MKNFNISTDNDASTFNAKQCINVNEHVPNIFYNLLKSNENLYDLQNLKSNAVINGWNPNNEGKDVLRKLAKNIELIRSKYSKNYEKRCRDLNFWLDDEIKTYQKKPNHEKISSLITTVFNDFAWDGTNKKVCNREENVYLSNAKSLMKELDDFCEIRDNIRCSIWDKYSDCLKYNYYVKTQARIFSERKELCGNESCQINDNCTLSNMDATFREINCNELYGVPKLDQMKLKGTKYTTIEIGFFIVITFLLVFLIFHFLRKFTPLRYWINTYLQKINIIRKNIKNDTYDDMIEYPMEHEQISSGDRNYSIEYGSFRE